MGVNLRLHSLIGGESAMKFSRSVDLSEKILADLPQTSALHALPISAVLPFLLP